MPTPEPHVLQPFSTMSTGAIPRRGSNEDALAFDAAELSELLGQTVFLTALTDGEHRWYGRVAAVREPDDRLRILAQAKNGKLLAEILRGMIRGHRLATGAAQPPPPPAVAPQAPELQSSALSPAGRATRAPRRPGAKGAAKAAKGVAPRPEEGAPDDDEGAGLP